jgi:glutathione S-transferase
MLQLVIGNKNYSSWSMRPWVLMTSSASRSKSASCASTSPRLAFRPRGGALSPAGRVPVLLDDGFAVWDTLAIAEYLHERFPDRRRLAADRRRARARSLCAEMHSRLWCLRSHCPMNIEAQPARVGARIWAEQPGCAQRGAHRALWADALAAAAGRFLFGAFCAADAFFAPVVHALRLRPAGVAGHARLRGAGVAAPWRGALGRRRAGRAGLPGLRGTLPPARA